MASRDDAIARAQTFFDEGGFRDRLAELVAIPSTSQDPGHEADVDRYLARGDPALAGMDGFHRRDARQPARRFRPDPGGRTDRGPGAADRADLRPRRHGARAGRPVARRPEPLGADGRGRPLVRPRHRRQQGPARAEPVGAGGGAGRARRQAGLQPAHGAGDVRGARLHRPARVRRGARRCAGGRCADRQRRAAGDAGACRRSPPARAAHSISTSWWICGRAACTPAIGAG